MATYHRVADLEDLAKQDAALSLGKGLPERAEAAGVSHIWAVHTLDTSKRGHNTFTLSSHRTHTCFVCSHAKEQKPRWDSAMRNM